MATGLAKSMKPPPHHHSYEPTGQQRQKYTLHQHMQAKTAILNNPDINRGHNISLSDNHGLAEDDLGAPGLGGD